MKFMDLVVKENSLKEEIRKVFEEVLASGQYVGGRYVEEFEKEFARWTGTKYCVSVSSGTDALKYALMALDIGSGDEVITTPLTFIATAEAIVLVGAKPVFVDVNSDTFLIDPSLLEEKITERTRAIIPVHLFGAVCDMEKIREVATKYGIAVVEDAAQAHGAVYKGKKAGSLGDIATFSFYPTKNLSAFGEAGAVTTDSAELARKVNLIKNHGQTQPYYHELLGENGRMDAIQAGILLAKLKYLDKWNEKRRKLAELYVKELQEIEEIKLQKVLPGSQSVYHLFVILTPRRERLLKFLEAKGIPVRIYYPVPLHLQPVFRYLGYKKGDFPNAELISSQLLALPIGPWMEDKDVIEIARAVKEGLVEKKMKG